MPKQLSDRQQRVILGVLVAVLLGFGVYLYVSASDGGPEEQQDASGAAEREASPPPLPVTDEQDLEFFDWLPFTEEEFLAAALVARDFTAAYGTYDATEDEEDYTERLAELATDDFAAVLDQHSGAGALRAELADSEAASQGRAEVLEVRHFDTQSVVFVVEAQSVTEDADGARETLGDFAVTVVRQGSDWEVHDLQPADAGDWGEER